MDVTTIVTATIAGASGIGGGYLGMRQQLQTTREQARAEREREREKHKAKSETRGSIFSSRPITGSSTSSVSSDACSLRVAHFPLASTANGQETSTSCTTAWRLLVLTESGRLQSNCLGSFR